MVLKQNLQMVSRHQRNRSGCGTSRSHGDKRTKKEHHRDPGQCSSWAPVAWRKTIGEASLRDAAIGTGIAVDKMLALTGQMPAVNIANIWVPSEEERQEMRETDRKLDEITARLRALDEARSSTS